VLITLTTDFGDSEYVGAMKGVIARLDPEAEVIDLTHGIRAHSIRHGAYALMTAVPHYPFAVHVAVVDPGVGTARRPIVIACEGAYLVGPDNGILTPAARRLGMKAVYHATNTALFLPEVSSTFHGRDVFAPLAAHLASGIKLREVGPEVSDWADLDFRAGAETPRGWQAEVICIDRFGNVITNIRAEHWAKRQKVGETFACAGPGGARDVRFVSTYADGKEREPVAVIGSGGYLELAVNQGSAAEALEITEPADLLLRQR